LVCATAVDSLRILNRAWLKEHATAYYRYSKLWDKHTHSLWYPCVQQLVGGSAACHGHRSAMQASMERMLELLGFFN
jgi:hypothetical protein